MFGWMLAIGLIYAAVLCLRAGGPPSEVERNLAQLRFPTWSAQNRRRARDEEKEATITLAGLGPS